MIITPTKISDVYVLKPQPKMDERGYFARIFAKEELAKKNIAYDIVQMNRSLTKEKGMIRGLHFQKPPYQEDKIVQCLKGSIFDVAVDIRPDSPTHGQWVGEILSEENMHMLLVPKGFAHGFQALENNVLVEYAVSEYYNPEAEVGHRWDEPSFAIDWPIKEVITSSKDASWPHINSSHT